MRILHVVKTTDGAAWAARQCAILGEEGFEVHVVLPKLEGAAAALWKLSNATLHEGDFSFPVRNMARWRKTRASIREMVDRIGPDLIHTHFVTNALALRKALGKNHPIPRIFQVPGPLHLEHPLYRKMEIASAGTADYWVASSQYTMRLYQTQGIPAARLFLSYYGMKLEPYMRGGEVRYDEFRRSLNLPEDVKMVGNINFMYPPKYLMGQTGGLKRHEDVIDALSEVCRRRDDVVGVLIGGQWGGGHGYRDKLVQRAKDKAGERIVMIDTLPFGSIAKIWPEFDCAAHVPISENCGGVIEPLAASVPTIASRVGGLPEVVVDGYTGWTVPPRDPIQLSKTILEVLADPQEAQRRGMCGRNLVQIQFDVQRTGLEIAHIYRHLLDPAIPAPVPFDSVSYLNQNILPGCHRE